MGVNTLLLALGANLEGPWGSPSETLRRARRELACAGLHILASSHIYDTAPLGPGRQAPYLNAVLQLQAHLAPAALLRLIKRIERRAGRRLGAHWGPRCLDIDILDYGGRQLGLVPAPAPARAPHPAASRDASARVRARPAARGRSPLAPSGSRGRRTHAACPNSPRASQRGIRQSLDFAPSACDKTGNEHAPRKQASRGAIACITASS